MHVHMAVYGLLPVEVSACPPASSQSNRTDADHMCGRRRFGQTFVGKEMSVPSDCCPGSVMDGTLSRKVEKPSV